MLVYFHNFWGGFIEKTNPVNTRFFIDLLKRVFDEDVLIGTFDNSDILFETVYTTCDSVLSLKDWKYSFLFSGESYCQNGKYTAILKQSRSYENIIHCPLFVPYMYCQNIKLNQTKTTTIPSKFACTFITNPTSSIRNTFIDKLEEQKNIDHFGVYKNNQGGAFPGDYSNVVERMSEYKFVICFENSQEDSYVTEKIINTLLAGSVPVYWGCNRIKSYFNENRFLNLETTDDIGYTNLINKMLLLDQNDTQYTNTVNHPILNFDSLNVNFNTIVNDIKRVIFNEYNISKIICIGSRETEPDRYIHLNKELHSLGIQEYLIEWNLPCFRDTIDFNSSLIKKFRLEGMFGPEELYRKKGNLSQLSLMINYYIIFKNILNYYKEGNFMILESDVIITEPDLVKKLLTCTYPNFDTINFGSGCNMTINSDTGAIEFHTKKTTRCTDSQIFSYAGIEKYVTYMESVMTFYTSIDFWMNDVINNTDIVYLWTSPSLTKQGSQHQLFDSFTEC
jgi:hypothetical protein